MLKLHVQNFVVPTELDGVDGFDLLPWKCGREERVVVALQHSDRCRHDDASCSQLSVVLAPHRHCGSSLGVSRGSEKCMQCTARNTIGYKSALTISCFLTVVVVDVFHSGVQLDRSQWKLLL